MINDGGDAAQNRIDVKFNHITIFTASNLNDRALYIIIHGESV